MPSSLQHEFPHAEIEVHLNRVLKSDAFRSSRRSQDFLRYVVSRVLDGHEDSIKERNIAVEVFERSLDYNTSEDSFVRVKASEVRRRLAAYYASSPADDVLRIELPLGSYVPHFVRIERSPTPLASEPPPFSPPVHSPWRLIAVVLALLAASGGVLLYSLHPRSSLNDFWTPILQTAEPLVIFLPIPSSYNPVGAAEAQRVPGSAWDAVSATGEHRFFAPTPHKVGVGAAIGAIRFAALCTRTGKAYSLKVGDDLSFADLRNQPAVIFGAFSSPWTVEINNEYRFKLIGGADQHIEDSLNPSRQWRATPGRYSGTPTEDYAIAGRVIDSKSGRTVIIAAGISTFGTQSAAEFLTEPARLAELARRAPRPLSQGSFQVLLYTRVIGNTPTPARIVDT
ncbi:MAG: hypothetical protein KGN84_19175, partial [Acidobacteriota bacterium]|nr:hypothetical protein [Acidobacteriota bacterium]